MDTNNKVNLPTPFDLAMMILSIISMAIIATVYLTNLEAETKRLMLMLDSLICILFITHFISRFSQATHKLRFIKNHGLDLLASIPFIAELRILRFLQVFRVLSMVGQLRLLLQDIIRQRVNSSLALLMVLMIIMISASALFIFVAESQLPSSNIKTAEDAIWWALVTVSTVGYGDSYPITTGGRIVAGMLIVMGISLFGMISGYLASNFLSPYSKESNDQQHQLMQQLMADNQAKHDILLAHIEDLQTEIKNLKKR